MAYVMHTNLLELLFLIVFALPNDSKIGLATKICCSRPDVALPAVAAKYWITFLVFSVLPVNIDELPSTYTVTAITRW